MNIFRSIMTNILINNKSLIEEIKSSEQYERIYNTYKLNKQSFDAFARSLSIPLETSFIRNKEQIVDNTIIASLFGSIGVNASYDINEITMTEKEFIKMFLKRNTQALFQTGFHLRSCLKFIFLFGLINDAKKYNRLSEGRWDIPYKGKSADGSFKYNYKRVGMIKNYIFYNKLHELKELDLFNLIFNLNTLSSLEQVKFEYLENNYPRLFNMVKRYAEFLIFLVEFKAIFIMASVFLVNIFIALSYMLGYKKIYLNYFCSLLSSQTLYIKQED